MLGRGTPAGGGEGAGGRRVAKELESGLGGIAWGGQGVCRCLPVSLTASLALATSETRQAVFGESNI